MFKNTYLGNSDNGLFVVFSRMNGNTEELDVSIADLICYAGKRPIILWKDDSAYSLTKVETSYDAQADETTVVAVFGDNGYKVVVSGAVNSASKGTFVYDAASGGSGSTGNDPVVVHSNNGTLDKIWQELFDAKLVIYEAVLNNVPIKRMIMTNCSFNDKGTYFVEFGQTAFICHSATDYPVIDED